MLVVSECEFQSRGARVLNGNESIHYQLSITAGGALNELNLL